MGDSRQGIKVRLRHLNGNLRRPPTRPAKTASDPIIEKNLEPLKHNTKKKVAQTLYYQNHPGEHTSPLTRDEKGPVHERLGVKQLRLRRLVPLGTDTASILPKKRFFDKARNRISNNNRMVLNNPGQLRHHKMQRVYSAQARLEKIRRSQFNTFGMIRLRRPNRPIPPATNLTVQVKNPTFVAPSNGATFNHNQPGVYKFKMVLNPVIQMEIAEIQRECVRSGVNTPLPARVTPLATNVPLTTRFALL